MHSKKKGFYMPLIYYTEEDRKLLINSDQILTAHYSSYYKCFVVTLFNNTEIRLGNEQYDEIMEQVELLSLDHEEPSERQRDPFKLPVWEEPKTDYTWASDKQLEEYKQHQAEQREQLKKYREALSEDFMQAIVLGATKAFHVIIKGESGKRIHIYFYANTERKVEEYLGKNDLSYLVEGSRFFVEEIERFKFSDIRKGDECLHLSKNSEATKNNRLFII
ncbi:MAG: hypothetical protein ACK5U7_08365 [Bacteroidota bacterium]